MDASNVSVLATISKHDMAGIAAVIIGVLLVVFSIFKIVAKTAGAVIFLGIGALAIIVAVLMFSRAL